MKQYLLFIFLILIVYGNLGTMRKYVNPVIKIKRDTLPKKVIDSIVFNTAELQRKNDSLKIVKNKLFKEELKLQDELVAKKTIVVVKEVPIFIYVAADSVKKKDSVNMSLIANINPKHKKQFFLFRLFNHHKKHKK